VRFVVPCLLFALVRCSQSISYAHQHSLSHSCRQLTDRALIVDFEGGFQASMADLFDLPLALDERTSPHQALTDEVVAFGGAYYFVPHLLYNPHLRADVERMFPDGKVAEPLTLFSMWPRKEVWNIVRQTRERFMPNASFVVGVQIRNNVYVLLCVALLVLPSSCACRRLGVLVGGQRSLLSSVQSACVCVICASAFAYDHTEGNAPDPVRTLKLSPSGPH
jgi:hypothetical protein